MADIRKIKQVIDNRLLAAQSELVSTVRDSNMYNYCQGKIAGIQEILVFSDLEKAAVDSEQLEEDENVDGVLSKGKTMGEKQFCIVWSDISGIEFIIAPNDVNTLRELELNGFVQITENSMHYMTSVKEGKQKLIDLGFVENIELQQHDDYNDCIIITDDNIDEFEAKDKSIAEKLQSKKTPQQKPTSPEIELKNKIKSQFPTIEFTETVRHIGKIQVTGDIVLGDRTITLYTYDAETYNIFNITGGFAYDDINMLTRIINKCNVPIKKEEE